MNLFSVSGKTPSSSAALVESGGRLRGVSRKQKRASSQTMCRMSSRRHSSPTRHGRPGCRSKSSVPTSRRQGIEQLIDAASAPAPISILVFAAATGVHKTLDQLTTRHLDWTFGLNVRAFFELVQRLSPRMPSGSSIVAISSEGAVRAVAQCALVGASKGALESLARHMAAELAPREFA